MSMLQWLGREKEQLVCKRLEPWVISVEPEAHRQNASVEFPVIGIIDRGRLWVEHGTSMPSYWPCSLLENIPDLRALVSILQIDFIVSVIGATVALSKSFKGYG